jgi:hypothetical protein
MRELSYDEHISTLKIYKKSYIHFYGKEKVNEWLGK